MWIDSRLHKSTKQKTNHSQKQTVFFPIWVAVYRFALLVNKWRGSFFYGCLGELPLHRWEVWQRKCVARGQHVVGLAGSPLARRVPLDYEQHADETHAEGLCPAHGLLGVTERSWCFPG